MTAILDTPAVRETTLLDFVSNRVVVTLHDGEIHRGELRDASATGIVLSGYTGSSYFIEHIALVEIDDVALAKTTGHRYAL